jgi:hypothetical protein
MFKKLVFASSIMLVSSTLFANADTQTVPWSIDNGSTVWHIGNPTGTTHVNFTVRQGSDSIHLMCGNTNTTVNPGSTVSCTLLNFVEGNFHIETYAHGSNGFYTIS